VLIKHWVKNISSNRDFNCLFRAMHGRKVAIIVNVVDTTTHRLSILYQKKKFFIKCST